MAVVKADGYGHGAVPVARAALDGRRRLAGRRRPRRGARSCAPPGIDAPLLAWLHDPDADFAAAVEAGIDLGVSSLEQLERGRAPSAGAATCSSRSTPGSAATASPRRSGARSSTAPRQLGARGRIRVRGIFSHLANACARGRPRAARRASSAALDAARRGRARPGAASTSPRRRPRSTLPEARFDLVRIGIGIYGLSPFDGRTRAARPAPGDGARARRVVAVKRVPPAPASRTATTYRTRARDDARARAARLRRRRSRATPRARARSRSAAQRSASPAASRWTSSSSTSATPRSRSATASCCSATRRPACRRPTTGPRPPARSTTRSSRASAPRVPRRYLRVIERRPSSPTAEDDGRASARASRRELRAGDLVRPQRRARRGQDDPHARARRGARRARAPYQPDLRARAHAPAPRRRCRRSCTSTPTGSASALELDDLDIDFAGSIVVVEWGAGCSTASPTRGSTSTSSGRPAEPPRSATGEPLDRRRDPRRRPASSRAPSRVAGHGRALGRTRRLDAVLLAIDTSAGTSVAVVDRDGGVLAERRRRRHPRPRRGHRRLIARVPRRRPGSRSRDLSGVVAGMGPGPFTGPAGRHRRGARLRVRRGQARRAGRRATTRSRSAYARRRGRLLVVTDARRREVYWSRLRGRRRRGPAGARRTGPALAKPDDARRHATATPSRRARRSPPAPLGMLAEAPATRTGARSPADEPLYLRSPDVTLVDRPEAGEP